MLAADGYPGSYLSPAAVRPADGAAALAAAEDFLGAVDRLVGVELQGDGDPTRAQSRRACDARA